MIKIWAEELNSHCTKEGIQMADRYMKKCSTSLITNHQENSNQNHMRCHLTPVRMAISKQTEMTNADEDMRQEPFNTVGGNVNW